MAEGEYLEGNIGGTPYQINPGGYAADLEKRLRSENPITDGEFYLFCCAEDSGSDRIGAIASLNSTLREKMAGNERYIVQITTNENSCDFGYAVKKLLENFSSSIKGAIQIEKVGSREYVYIKNQGLNHLVDSSCVWDFYKRIYENYIIKK
jgi:hypothetical protein